MTEQQHPLTDDIIEENFTPEYGYIETDSILGVSEINLGFSCNDLRAAFDKGAAHKMEQVIQFLEANKDLSVETALRFIGPAMRPQEDNND